MNKPFRDIKRGDVFRPVGSPAWREAASDAQPKGPREERGPFEVLVGGQSEAALGHLIVELQ